MAVAVLEQVQPVLAAFADRLRSVLDRAMGDWLKTPDRGRYRYPRTRANIIFDHIARHAILEFDGDGDGDVKALTETRSIKFLFHDAVVARFKKGNARGVGSNIHTQAVMDFVDPQGCFNGLPEIHRVEIVYQLNILGTGFAEVSVVARDRRTRIWAYPLTSRPSAEIIPLPSRVSPVLHPPVVTPKAKVVDDSESKPAE